MLADSDRKHGIVRLAGRAHLAVRPARTLNPQHHLSLARQLQHRSARRIRHFKAIYKILRSVIQSMKGHVVKRAVRNDDQGPAGDQPLDGSEDGIIELDEVLVRGAPKLPEVCLDVARTIVELLD